MTMSLDTSTSHEQRPAATILDTAVIVPLHGTEDIHGIERHDLATHRSVYGELGRHTADELVAALEQVRLTGRGGGHFPAALKWKAVLAAGRGGTVVVNAAEGEPGCAKDAVLVQTRPHLVIDGLVAAMDAVDAADGVIWLHDGADASAQSVSRALVERASLHERPIRVLLAPARYLSGEATGIIRTLEGGPTLPRYVRNPAQPWTDGHKPVLVNNAETMARVGLVALRGADAYRSTSLVTVINHTYRVVLEVGSDSTIGDVLDTAWRPVDGQPAQAVLLGGYGGSWVEGAKARSLRVDVEALRAEGLSLGAGLIGPLPATSCGLEESARLVRYLAGQSARQCGPCVFGLAAVADLASDLSGGRLGRKGRRNLDRFMHEIAGRGACRHPDGALRMYTSALHVFSHDVHTHRRGRTCDAPTYAVMPLPEEES